MGEIRNKGLENQSDMLGILYVTATCSHPADTNLQVRSWDIHRGPVDVEGDLVHVGKCLKATNLQTNANDKRAKLRVVR